MPKAILLFALDQLEVVYNGPHKQREKLRFLPSAFCGCYAVIDEIAFVLPIKN
jgi:hypothetical protein